MLKHLFLCLTLSLATYLTAPAQEATTGTNDSLPPTRQDTAGAGRATDRAVDRDYHREANARAAQKTDNEYAAPNDRTPVAIRQPDSAQLTTIHDDRAYRYGNDLPPTASPWDRFLAWFWSTVEELFRSKAYRNAGQYLLMATIAGGVVWLLYKAEFLGNLFPNRAKQAPLGYNTLDDNIHEINFTDRINQAVEARHYRLAVRLLYLQSLKSLADAGLIRWQADKTNRQYALELMGNPKRLPFEQLTTQFEYVWYGDFPVDEARFGLIRQQFNQFNQ